MSRSLPGWQLQFASDNTAGICPEAFDALKEANSGFAPSYGQDAATLQVCEHLRNLFETDCDVYFVFNGTAANSLALAALCQSYQSVICADSAHVETDECGAPEFFSNGSKLLLSPACHGKLTTRGVSEVILRRSDIHYPRSRVLTVTQSTEQGTVYRPEELAELSALARKYGLRVHMDGARFANAVASLDCRPADITWKAGIDVLCFGGTKMGLPVGEAILFFDPALGQEFAYRCKQAGQLASKMRFLAAPWLKMLENDNWLRHARHANLMARRLADKVSAFLGDETRVPTESNAVFVVLPQKAIDKLRDKGWAFYTFIGGRARFMCSWATTEEAVDALADDIAAALS